MPYVIDVHECTPVGEGVFIQARVVTGSFASGTMIRSATSLTYEPVTDQGEFVELRVARQETRQVEFGPVVLVGAAVLNADGSVPRGYGVWARIDHVPPDGLWTDLLLSDLEEPGRF